MAADDAVRKTVTVLFCDLAGSTALEERVDAESSRDIIGRYHELIQQVIEGHGGSVAKFIGDGAMALFGVPEVAVDDAERAVDAGLELQRRFLPLGQQITDRFGARQPAARKPAACLTPLHVQRTRPGESYGRSASHAATSNSMSSGDASGFSRRSRWRRSAMPSSCMSNAARSG